MGTQDMGTTSMKMQYKPTSWQEVAHSCGKERYSTQHHQHSLKMTNISNKIVLVTGAAGFIGMHTAIELKQQGYAVVGIDNFNDYYPVSLKRAREAYLKSHSVYVVDGDINETDLIVKLGQVCGGFSHVVHLAGQPGVRYASKNPESYIHANLAGQVALLEVLSKQRPMPAIIYASSSSIYGLNQRLPFSEEDITDQPVSLYAATKKVCFNLDLVTMLLFTKSSCTNPYIPLYIFLTTINTGR